MPGLKLTPPALRSELEDFYANYAWLIDEKMANEWVGLFVEDGVYAVGSHNNVSTTGMWWYTDRSLLKLKERAAYTNGYHWHNPTRLLHVVHNIRAQEQVDGAIAVQAAFTLYAADQSAAAHLHVVGRYTDLLVRTGDGELRFAEHRVVIEGETVPGNMGILL